MFDYSLLHWATFVSATLLLNLSPGPDMAFMLAQTINGGRARGFSAMLGMWLATAGHAVIAAFGLSAILLASATVFTLMKWAGAIYLVWLGYQALRSSGSALIADKSVGSGTDLSNAAVFRQGFFVCLLNPKVALFFMAFLPQFVVAGAGPTSAQLLLHGVLVVVISGLVEPPMIIFADRMSHRIRNSVSVGRWLNRCLGCLLIALGVKLALSRQ